MAPEHTRPDADVPSFVAVLRRRAGSRPDQRIFTFLADNEVEGGADDHLSAAGLDRRARAIAARLQSLGLAGERALLLYPPGLEFLAAFFGCLYAGVVAVPAPLPRANRPMDRLRAIVNDSRPRAVLIPASRRVDVGHWWAGVPELERGGRHLVVTDEIDEGLARQWIDPDLGGDALAFLQYTSGSTASPRGVMISHGNLLRNSAMIASSFGSTRESRGVFWLPLYHDMGLIGGVLQTVYCGGSSTLLSPAAFLQRPLRWLRAIAQTGATISGAPNFAYELCTRKVTPEQREGLDLGRWRVAFNGAEPIRPEVLDRFAEAFAPCGFRREAFLPCYGLAEATLLVSGGPPLLGARLLSVRGPDLEQGRAVPAGAGDVGARSVVGCGRVDPGLEVVIIDPVTRARSPAGMVGEIWVAGPSVARGYWGRADATEETFRADPAGGGPGPFLRTGDLGFLRGEDLFVTGRLKDLIIVRGRNIYPQDVEWTVERCHPALRTAAAFSVMVEGEERLVIACEAERSGGAGRAGIEVEVEEVVAAIERSVAEQHDLEVHAVRLLRPMGLPRTSSGKVRRQSCRDGFVAGTLPAVAGWTRPVAPRDDEAAPAPGSPLAHAPERRREAMVDYLRRRIAAVLRVEPGRLRADSPLYALGLDSLLTIELKGAIEADLGIVLPLQSLLEGPTIAELADRAIERSSSPVAAVASAPVRAIEAGAEVTPSVAQQALWYAHQLATSGAGYNMAGGARVRSRVDLGAFRRGIGRLVERHEALRTSFPAVDGRPSLRIRDDVGPCLAIDDASGWSEDDLGRRLREEAGRPFDLEDGPLFRVYLWTRSPREHVVLLVLHHIIGDFWTTAVLVDEFGRLYAAERAGADAGLEPLPLRFTDFVRWQDAMLVGPEGERLWSYWRSRLAAPLPELDLPSDRPRPAIRSGRGGVRYLDLDERLTRALVAFGEARGASLYTCLLAGLHALLSRLGGREDVIVGSPVAARTRPGLEGLVGYFVNIVPMRADLSGDPEFEALVARVRRVVHEGLEHQDFPYALMARRLPDQGRDPGQTPIFQVVFIHQKAQRLGDRGLSPFALSAAGHAMELGGLPLESIALHTQGAPFDLTLMTALVDGRLSMSLEYSTDLFDADTADRLLGSYRTLLAGAVADPRRRLADLPLLDEAERRRVLVDWGSGPALEAEAESDAGANPDRDACIHELFEARARRAPGAMALVFGDERVTYGELNARANRVAHHLRAVGMTPGAIVGLHADRSPAMMAGLLGILKAGGAYVPLDPALPADRLAMMRLDASVPVLVTDGRSGVDAAGATVVDLVADAGSIAGRPGTDPPRSSGPSDLAYVIYTSGSTGTPKGVMVSHASLVNAYRAWERAYGLDGWAGRHLQVAGAAFDVFTGDWARALCSGGALVSCPREAFLDPEVLHELLVREGVDCAEFVPAGIEGLIDHMERTGRSLGFLRLVAVGSDLMYVGQYQRLRRLLGPEARLVNSYGLTEATIDSTYFEGDLSDVAPDRPVPIGRPFAGTRAYVLDGRLGAVPVGMTGELYIGGPGVARGYLNQAALTAERFLPDPFGEAPGARLYRTGDLGRWRPDGTLELLGRADRQVKVRGYRIELGEVESALLRHTAVREAAVVVREGEMGGRHLAAAIVAVAGARPPTSADLRRWLKRGLPEYMVPSSFQVLEALPLSPNGKVDRRALAGLDPPPPAPSREADGSAPPRTPTEEVLARVAAEVVGLGGIGIHDNFFELGVDSIAVIRIVSRARQAGLDLTPGQVFRHPTVAELAAVLAPAMATGQGPEVSGRPLLDPETLGRLRDDDPGIEDAYPLSPAQEGMLFHSFTAPESGVYVEQFTCRLRGRIDLETLAASWRYLFARHAALRTAIRWVDSGSPVQVVFREVELPLERLDWADAAPDERPARLESFLRADRARGFVPTWAPLMRLALIGLGGDTYQLVWSLHHAVIDGWCVPLLFAELLDVYDALCRGVEPDLPPSRPFRDYIAWLRDQDPAPAEAFWRPELAGFTEPTPLGIDWAPAGAAPGPHADREVRLSAELTASLTALTRARQLTLSTIVQGAWAILLARYSGREDVAFGLTVSGRPAALAGVEAMVGMFINTLPMRLTVDERDELVPWLRRLQRRQVDLRQFEHSPLVQVQGWSDVPRGLPLFESIVVVENFPVDAALASRAVNLGVEEVRFSDQTNYPLDLTVVPGAELWLKVGYDADRFDPETIDRLLGHLRILLGGIAADPDRCLADLPMLTGGEKEQLLRRWNDTGTGIDLPEGGALPLLVDLDRLPEDEVDSWIEHLRSSGGELR